MTRATRVRHEIIRGLLGLREEIAAAGWDRLAALMEGDNKAAEEAYERQQGLYLAVEPLRQILAKNEAAA